MVDEPKISPAIDTTINKKEAYACVIEGIERSI